VRHRVIERNHEEKSMTTAKRVEEDQAALWNGAAGQTWVEAQEPLDRMFRPLEELLVEAVLARGARNVLDVGCGTGATTLAIARALGARGRSVGVDISEPMVALARARAESQRLGATFVVADAQTHAFAEASFDTIVSRFGVMFFADPVQAFVNLRRAVRPAGDLALIAWRGPSENPFMTAAERAAAPFLPDIPPRSTDAPGQFAFADPSRVAGILERSGWSQIDLRPLDVVCTFAKSDLVGYLTRIGPIGRALRAADEETRARITGAVLPAFDSYVRGAEVRFVAGCWMIRARSM
jgi:SAM-dependent methyltransferase